MRRIASSIDIAAPPGRIWPFVANIEWWPRWGLLITAVDSEAGEIFPGLSGRVRTRLGFWLPFTIGDVVAESFWDWFVGGVPATGHHLDSREGHTRVRFTAPWVVAPYKPVMTASLKELKRLVESA